MSGSGDDLTGLAVELGDAAEEVLGEEATDLLDGEPRADSEVEAAETPEEGVETASDGGVEGLTSVRSGFDAEWSVRRMVWTMVPLLAGLSVLQMASGAVLETYEDILLQNPALLILVPVQIGTAGNLASIMCARLSTQLHLGTFEFSPSNPGIRANVGAIFGLAATVFTIVGFAAWGIGTLVGGVLTLVQVLTISLFSGMALALLVVIISVLAVQGSYKVGLNPDDTTIPLVTNICDIAGVLILFGVVAVVL